MHVDDDGFVRAPAAACYRTLTDVAGWPAFAPDTRVDVAGENRFELALGRGRDRLRLVAEASSWRHDAGFKLALTGDITGTAEFWLEPGWGGTVVHHLVNATVAGSQPARVHAAYRRWLRHLLWGLKDVLQDEVRRAEGLTP